VCGVNSSTLPRGLISSADPCQQGPWAEQLTVDSSDVNGYSFGLTNKLEGASGDELSSLYRFLDGTP
jgi:hypothetical protein